MSTCYIFWYEFFNRYYLYLILLYLCVLDFVYIVSICYILNFVQVVTIYYLSVFIFGLSIYYLSLGLLQFLKSSCSHSVNPFSTLFSALIQHNWPAPPCMLISGASVISFSVYLFVCSPYICLFSICCVSVYL